MLYDALDARAREEREADLMRRLPGQVAHAKENTPFYRELLAGIDPRSVDSRAALAALPLTRKSELVERQRAQRPFGGLNATAPAKLARIFMSPGPIYDPEGREPDFWRTSRALFAAGFRAGDVALNCFSYHFSPAASMFETGLHHLGCVVIPGGTGQTEMQVRAINDLEPVGYVGTPSFLKIILKKPASSGSSAGRFAARWSRARLSCRQFASSCRNGGSPHSRRTAPRTSASSPTRARRARGSW
jgi:phenylacetate-CoA ligase